MRKNLFAIEIAVGIILLTMLLTGIFLKEIIITWLAIGLIVLGGLTLVIIKIVNLAKEDVKAAEEASKADPNYNANSKKNIFSNVKKAWQYSTNGERIKSILFVFTIMICSIAFIVLCSYGYINIGLIVFASGIGLIVVSLIIMALIDKYLKKQHMLEQSMINQLADCKPVDNNVETEESTALQSQDSDNTKND